MRHIIFTNFGVGITDQIWLLYRLKIFAKTTAISLTNQSCTNFEWHIFVDDRLPAVFHEELVEIVGNSTRAHIHKVKDYPSIKLRTRTILEESDEVLLITSRMDDDDFVHIDAIKLIQQQALESTKTTPYEVISLVNGIEYLPGEDTARPVENETIAICLSLVDRSKEAVKLSVTYFAHHQINETLTKQGFKSIHSAIRSNEPLYVYNKHQLSDSYFFGARKRILDDANAFRLSQLPVLQQFGATRKNIELLQRTIQGAPLGMPYKYLERLSLVRDELKALKQNITQPPKQEELDRLELHKSTLESIATRKNFKNYSGRKIRVAILGSCVTRDLFEIEKANLVDYEIVFYSARSSVVSYMSLPNSNGKIRITGNGFEDKRAQFDLSKEHWSKLEISQPDLVLIDFIDERIGLIAHEGSIFSASGPITKAFERAQIDYRIIRPWNPTICELRKWSIQRFLKQVNSICPNIILHKAEWSSNFINSENVISSFAETEFTKLIELNNDILHTLFVSVENSLIPADLIGGTELKSMQAGGDHLWSFSPFHYDKNYYKALAKQLKARAFLLY